MADPDWFVKSYLDIASFFGKLVSRMSYTRMNPWTPRYTLLMAAPSAKWMQEGLEQVRDGLVSVVLDPASPFKLSTDDARAAFSIQEAKKAHGKLVFVL
jgi:NADPH:quinone reductase-like Zn-dependent oxidoreductase